MARAALFVSSGDLIADRRYKWALDHAARGDRAAALDILQQTVELAPRFATAWFALGALRDAGGDREAAIAAFDKAAQADPDDYHGARLHLARLGAGETTPAMTTVYVQRLFDQHAPEFDKSLVENLGYRGPAILLDAVQTASRPDAESSKFGSVLDLGCGTGLAGAMFRPLTERLAGVDISSQMVEQARMKRIYDRLEVQDIVPFLEAERTRRQSYDLVLAADVFVYFSELSPAIGAVVDVLAPNGLFAFTVETHSGDGVLLQQTLRYAHGAAYMRGAIEAAGLNIRHLAPVSTRTEKGIPVPGLVVVGQRT